MCTALWSGYYLGTTVITANTRLNSRLQMQLVADFTYLSARQSTFNVTVESFRRNALPCFSPFTMQCTSFDCVPDSVSPPCQSEEWTPPSGPPPHPPSCKIVGHVDACLWKNRRETLPHVVGIVSENSFHSVEKVWASSPTSRKHQQTNWKLACSFCFRVLYTQKTHKSSPAKPQRVLWRPVIGLCFEAPYWLTLDLPSWFLGVAMVTSPHCVPAPVEEQLLFFSLSQTLLPAHWARRFPG